MQYGPPVQATNDPLYTLTRSQGVLLKLSTCVEHVRVKQIIKETTLICDQ